MLVGAIIVAWRYPLDRDTHEQIRRQLLEQRQVNQT
jgi:Na+/melibiose symporter-like transporter